MSEFPCQIRYFNALYPVAWRMKKRNLNRLKFKQKKSNLGADHLTSEGVDDFRKKISCKLISRKYLPYNGFVCQGKIYHQRFGKKILTCTQTKSPIPPHPPSQKSNGWLLKKNWTKTRRTITKKAKALK